MGNIIGEPFSDYVREQVRIRQEVLGSESLNSDDLKYITTKTPWLRLASSVNLTANEISGSIDPTSVLGKLVANGVDVNLIRDNKLASSFILFGGSMHLDNLYSKEEDKNIIDYAEGGIEEKFRTGLNYNAKDNPFGGAYGWGGIEERGYVPMPGIESVTTTYLNNGALSKTSITMKCFSKAQFQLLDVLYLRPGYSLLLEFGWSTYMNNTRELSTFPSFKSEPLAFLLEPSIAPVPTQYYMYNLIATERAKYDGNYEAVFGKIVNFKWEFNTDGAYICTVDLLGMGSIIDSLKLNVVDTTRNKDEKGSSSTTNNTKELSFEEWKSRKMGAYNYSIYNSFIGKHNLEDPPPCEEKTRETRFLTTETYSDCTAQKAHVWKPEILAALRQAIRPLGGSSATKADCEEQLRSGYDTYIQERKEDKDLKEENTNNNPLLSNKDKTALNKVFYEMAQSLMIKNENNDLKNSIVNGQIDKYGLFKMGNTLNGEKTKDGGDETQGSVFIKFGALLKVIEEKANLFSTISSGTNSGTPLVQFDFKYGDLNNDTNFMSIIPPNLSTNPKICIVPWSKMSIEGLNFDLSSGGDLPTDSELNTFLQNYKFLVEGNPYIGRLGNVLINLRFAALTLDTAQKDEDGAISVLSYIQAILQGINESMGSINNFKVTFDENDGLIKIYDETPLPGLIDVIKEDKYTKFNIFGVGLTRTTTEGEALIKQGSFITNLSLNAEIPKNFAAMITIGAQASANNLSGNSTSFSTYNRGLVDRITPEKVDSTQRFKIQDKEEVRLHPKQEAVNLKNEKIYYQGSSDKISAFSAVYTRTGKSSGGNVNSYNFNESITADFTENYTTYIKLIQGILTDHNQVPQPFFLPFNLNLEMEGLSGMKLYQKFRITDDILPPSYEKDSVDIIIKAINHTVDTQSWTTTLDTMSVPRFNKEDKVAIIPFTYPASPQVVENTESEDTGEIITGDTTIGGDEVPAIGIKLIKEFEGCHLNAYKDPLSGDLPITIGWGTTLKKDGSKFVIGDKITQAEADEYLIGQVKSQFLPKLKKIPGWDDMSNGKKGALLSFSYNLSANFYGNSNFSTITAKLKNKQWEQVPDALYLYRNPGSNVEAGLARRRKAEGSTWTNS